jgi:hypothetical protein
VRRDQAPGRGPLNLSASSTPIKLLDACFNSASHLKARLTQHNGSVKVGFHVDHRRPPQDRLVSRAENSVAGVRRPCGLPIGETG